MKNTINYYYNLYPSIIIKEEKGYSFFINETRYFLIPYLGDINEINKIYDMHLNLLKQNFYIHPIVLNNMGNILTLIDNKPYILMITIYYKEKININNILEFRNTKVSQQTNLNMAEIWAMKNDYLEYQMNQLGKKHPILRDSFSYYIGLGETAIEIMNSLKIKLPLIYAHKRIDINDTLFDLYNPLNIIIDYKVRDVAEYLKSQFFNDGHIDLALYLNNLNQYEYILVLARMLYPTYYFDLYEEIITDRKDDLEIKKIINKVNDYEILLKQIYHHMKTFIPNIQIEWLE